MILRNIHIILLFVGLLFITIAKGQNTNLPTIRISIDDDGINTLRKNRESALFIGVLSPDYRDKVKGVLTLDSTMVNVRLRLKGDLSDHWYKYDKWSLRVYVDKGASVFGMRKFSLQHPKTREYVNEWFYHKFLKSNGLIGLRYMFAHVYVNEKYWGIQAIEEGFDKALIQSNGRLDGPILKFDDAYYWHLLSKRQRRDKFIEWYHDGYAVSDVSVYGAKKGNKNEDFKKQMDIASEMLLKLKSGELSVSDVIDIKAMARLFAIKDLFGTTQHHSVLHTNIRFYYDPILSKLEPIGFDNYSFQLLSEEGLVGSADNTFLEKKPNEVNWFEIVFSDKEFYKEYIRALREITNVQLLENFKSEIQEEYRGLIQEITQAYPAYVDYKTHFQILAKNQYIIKSYLNDKKLLKARTSASLIGPKLYIDISNLSPLPIEIIGVEVGDHFIKPESTKFIFGRPFKNASKSEKVLFEIPSKLLTKINKKSNISVRAKIAGSDIEHVFPVSYHQNVLSKEMLSKDKLIGFDVIKDRVMLDKKSKKLLFKAGLTNIESDVFIPKGYNVLFEAGSHIRFFNSASLVSYGSIRAEGNIEKAVIFESGDSLGGGILISSNEESVFRYCSFKDLKPVVKSGINLNAGLSFYLSNIVLMDCEFRSFKAANCLRFIRSNFQLENISLYECNKNAFQIQYSVGSIKDARFIKVKGDGIRLKSSTLDFEKVYMEDLKGNGVFLSEGSTIEGSNLLIKSADKGLSLSEQSSCIIGVVHIENSNTSIEVSSKDASYGQSKCILSNYSSTPNNYILEPDNVLSINGKYYAYNKPKRSSFDTKKSKNKDKGKGLTLENLQALIVDYPSADNFVKLSLAYYSSGNYLKCIEYSLRALDLKPDYAIAYNNIGASYNSLGQWQKAIKALEKAVGLDPNSKLAINNLQFAREQLR